MITLSKLNATLGLTLKELDRHGFLTDKVSRTDVFLSPLSWEAYGWQYYRSSGHIHIPAVVATDLLRRLFGRQSAFMLRDVLRHEYGHAVALHHPGLMRSNRFRNAFWTAHDSSDLRPWKYDPELFVSCYAASHPREDFAEKFMLFLRHKGKIPQRHNTPAIRAKWNFIGLLGRTLARGRRKW
jgi:hypothetical protein